MATLVSFWSILEDRMANLGLIDFKLGLYTLYSIKDNKPNLKFISQNIWQNCHQLAQNRSDATFGPEH